MSNLQAIQGKILRDYLLEGIALGILAYIFVLALFYWVAREESIYLVYSIYILSAIGWIIGYFGLGFQMLWPNTPPFNTVAAPLFACFHMALNIHLCQVIVRTHKLSKIWNNICNGVKLIFIFIGIVPLFINLNNYGYQVNSTYLYIFLSVVILGLSVMVFSIVFSLKTKTTARFYLYASLIKISGILNLTLLEMGVTPGMYRLEQLLVGGLLIEVFLLSYGLAKRSQLQKLHLRKQKQAAYEKEISLQKEIAKAHIEIQEQTLKNISQEIHDNIGQMLTLLKLNLERIKSKVTSETGSEINDAQLLVQNIIQDLRNLSQTLNSDMLAKLGLEKAIEIELKAIGRVAAIHVSLDWDKDVPPLKDHVELIIFRIMQEAFHNILKHAQSTAITVKAGLENDHVIISVCDNGIGFEKAARFGAGNGLLNLESRCQLINAKLDVVSSPGCGTEIIITYPLSTILATPSREKAKMLEEFH